MGLDTQNRAGKLLRFELPASPADGLEPAVPDKRCVFVCEKLPNHPIEKLSLFTDDLDEWVIILS